MTVPNTAAVSPHDGAITTEAGGGEANQGGGREKMYLDLPLDLGTMCILANHAKWRKQMRSGLWKTLVVFGFCLSWLQLMLAFLLFTGDAGSLERNLFVLGADNSQFLTLRALCMLLIFLMTFSHIFSSLKKLAMHSLVLDNVSDPVSFFAAFVASGIKILSTGLTILVSLMVTMSSPDDDGAISIVMNFTALLIVAEIDDAVTPFVLDFCGIVYGRHDLMNEAGRFIDDFEFSDTESERFRKSKRLRNSVTGDQLLFVSLHPYICWYIRKSVHAVRLLQPQ